MGNIVLLDDLTINKIAAGEVIERPASVIKEMVENSIDAGATNVTVEIKNGGISYIKVADNGKGIAQDDLEIAFERHATSKIRSAEDLDKVKSMGFRGEALASIAAIANVEMVSRTKEQENGYRVVVEGGDILEKELAGCSVGTTITVRNLFFNTPVRYKFLKKDYTESGYIEDVVTRIALVHPEISIRLINTGKTVIQTNGSGDLKNVIYSIYGKDISSSVMNVDYKYEDVTIKGVVGKPEIARSNRANQLFFVNSRYIKDKTLTAATEQAYKGLIPIGKFGFVVLNLEVNPAKVDVNVHPAKLEVRFEEESKIFQAIYHAIKDTLLKTELVSDTGKKEEDKLFDRNALSFEQRLKIIQDNKKEKEANNLFSFRKQHEKEIEKYNDDESKIKTNMTEEIQKETQEEDKLKFETSNKEESANIQELKKEEPKENLEDDILNRVKEKENQYILDSDKETENEQQDTIDNNIGFEEIKENIEKLENNTNVVSDDFNEMYARTFGKAPISENKITETSINSNNAFKLNVVNEAPKNIKKTNISIFEEQEEFKKPPYKFIGIVFKTYIILEMNNEMYILDQHAAHERIMYEKVKKNYYSEASKDSQMLLLPDVITLTHKEMEIAKENFGMFRQAGFMLEEFGENTIKLTGVPTICEELNTKELFLETLDEINTVARTAKQEKEERFIATVACKAAVKANMALDVQEVDKLMEQLLSLPNPFTCPHGRPTTIKMTKYDIERKFARKQ